MHIIIGIIIFLVFLGAAPRFFKWLLAIDVAIGVVYYLGLRICAIIIGAGKGGRNSGALADYIWPSVYAMMAAPAIVALGLLFAFLMYLARRNTGKVIKISP